MVYIPYFKTIMSIKYTYKGHIALLINKKAIISAKYLYYAIIFLKKLIAKLFKCSNINNHIINLKPDKKSSYGAICSFGLIQFKIFKIYIEINLAN